MVSFGTARSSVIPNTSWTVVGSAALCSSRCWQLV